MNPWTFSVTLEIFGSPSGPFREPETVKASLDASKATNRKGSAALPFAAGGVTAMLGDGGAGAGSEVCDVPGRLDESSGEEGEGALKIR